MPHLRHILPLSLLPLTLAVTLLLLCLSSCTSVREAQQVVAEADSLRTVGVQYDDSAAMAGAAASLQPFRLFYPTAYAHANYYYGRLLRAHDNHPEAMLAFLRVVHSRTKDHAIKGSSYSNMGTMCRLATEHELAFNIYGYSAEEFLQVPDTIAYYYALNNMAYELAEQGNKAETYALLSIIESQCSNQAVLTKLLETKADACINVQHNDSAIYYSTLLWTLGNHEPTGLLIRAQAYDNLGEKDSALLYTNKLLESSSFYGDRFNALYIITHNDTTINVEEVLSLTSDRTDIQMEYTEIRSELSHAIQLLQQDLHKKPNLTWLFAMLGTVLTIGIIIVLYVKRKRRQHQLISQQIAEKEQQKEELSLFNQQLKREQSERSEKILADIEVFCHSIQNSSDLNEKLCWDDFDKMCSTINIRMFGLADKLTALGILNEREIRLCILIALGNFRDKEMAEILFYGENSIRTVKTIVAKKLGTTGKELRSFLLNQVVF